MGHRCRLVDILFVVLMYICDVTNACSPPRSKYGEYSIKQQTEIGRSDKAAIIVLGTVVNIYPDKRIQSMKVRIAVHMVLKSKTKLNKYLKVSGFEIQGKNNRNTLFVHQAVGDCVTTEVNLYGTYVFFLRTNKYNELSVDEINFQPAVTEIPCAAKLSKQLKRLIRKYRKTLNQNAQCNDFAKSQTSNSRKCLKHRYFTRLINEFKFKEIQVRKTYCAAVRQKALLRKLRKNRKNRKQKTDEPTMHDMIVPSKENKPNKSGNDLNNGVDNNDSKTEKAGNTVSSNYRHSQQTNIILYSKSENFILNHNTQATSRSKSSAANNNHQFRVNVQNWRLFREGAHSLSNELKPNTSIIMFFSTLILLMSLVFVYV